MKSENVSGRNAASTGETGDDSALVINPSPLAEEDESGAGISQKGDEGITYHETREGKEMGNRREKIESGTLERREQKGGADRMWKSGNQERRIG